MKLQGYTYNMSIKAQGKQSAKRSYFAPEFEMNRAERRANVYLLVDELGTEEQAKVCATSDATVDVEFKTQPSTLEHGFKAWARLWEIATDNGFNGCGCGLHVHVMRSTFGITRYAQAVGAYKMGICFSRFTHIMEEMAGRSCNQWARVRLVNEALENVGSFGRHPITTDAEDFLDYMENAVHEWHGDRYCVLNCDKDFSFELRLGAGRETWEETAEYLRMVQAFVNLCKRRNLGVQWFLDCTEDAFVRELNYERSLITC